MYGIVSELEKQEDDHYHWLWMWWQVGADDDDDDDDYDSDPLRWMNWFSFDAVKWSFMIVVDMPAQGITATKTCVWATSQACPLRRSHLDDLYGKIGLWKIYVNHVMLLYPHFFDGSKWTKMIEWNNNFPPPRL